jgi:anaerobic ribonucleoside-triphosphate reductase activating protein
MFGTQGGKAADSESLAVQALAVPGLEGVSILGGEPFEQPTAVADFCERVRAGGLSVMVYSGYTLPELHAMESPDVDRLLKATDLLVDGRYEKSIPEPRRRWIGSSNQQMHFLSGRYRKDDERFARPNTVELRWLDGQLTVNGWPSAADALRKGAK